MHPDSRPGIAWSFIFLLCSHEVLSARRTIQSEQSATVSDWTTVNSGSSGFGGFNLGGMKALDRLEQLVEGVQREVHAWAQRSPKQEQTGQTSLLDLQNHLDRTVLSEGGLAGEAQRGALLEDLATLRAASAKVENMNLFLCKRSEIQGYADDGLLFQKRKLENGKFSVSCSNKVSLLKHGTVGQSVTGKDKEQIAGSIDSLKEMTASDSEHAAAFPIHLSMCTSPDGDCKSESTHQSGFVDDKSGVFGKDTLTHDVPIPERLMKYLPRHRHNPTHLYAVCFDDQDECGGMMWIPKNLHSCSGWFKGKDARATLGHLRDAVLSGAWGRWWTPSGKDRVRAELHLGKGDAELKSDLEKVEGVEEDPNTRSCPLMELQERERQEEITDVRETLQELGKLPSQYEEKANMIKQLLRELTAEEQTLRAQLAKHRKNYDIHRDDPDSADVAKIFRQKMAAAEDSLHVFEEKTKPGIQQDIGIIETEMLGLSQAAETICKDAAEAGEGIDCKDSGDPSSKQECLNLFQACKELGHTLTAPPCRSADQMAELMNVARADDAGSFLQQSSVDHGYRHRRRRRHGSAFMDILFPSYYYHHTPYCYPWYGYHGRFYAYPLYPMPNVGGFTFGLGTFHPGVMVIEGMGHLAFHMGRGLAYVGSSIANGIGGGLSLPSCEGDACLYLFLGIIVFAVVTIVGVLVYKHCTSSEENCNTPWFHGSRLRKKTHKWMRLWTGIEEHVYAELKHGLIFDAKLQLTKSQDRCLQALQWGRKWVRKTDERWLIENRTA